MPDSESPYAVVFPPWFDERWEAEMPDKGYVPDVEVRLAHGPRYRLYFTDPVRARQDAETEFESGRTCYWEPGLVLIPEVTRQRIEAAVADLYREGFFALLRPLEGSEASSSHAGSGS